MIEAGNAFVRQDGREYFVNSKGEYVDYPAGYIRGPHFESNGNPRPFTMSVQGLNGWHQRGFTKQEHDRKESFDWALKTAKKVLTELKESGE